MSQSGLKVVAHLLGGTLVKGYIQSSHSSDAEAALREQLKSNTKVRLHGEQSGDPHEFEIGSLKALFFVKTFEGRGEYKEIKFFQSNPTLEGLWVQLRFDDGEVTEGILQNSLRYLMEPGFFLKPPDPNSNNEYVFVAKNSLAEFRVLGVRSKY